jgi:hypothetical protein
MIEVICSSETSVLTRVIPEAGLTHSHRRENLALAERSYVSCEVRTRFYIQEDGILHTHRRESLKSYTVETFFAFKVGPLYSHFLRLREQSPSEAAFLFDLTSSPLWLNIVLPACGGKFCESSQMFRRIIPIRYVGSKFMPSKHQAVRMLVPCFLFLYY